MAILESIILYQTRPSLPLLLVVCTQLSDRGQRRGKRTSQEKVMMFVMSLRVDLSLAAKSPDSHSQAITHTPCFPHKLCEGLLGNEDALIWGCGEHYITQPCVHHGHVSPLPLWLLSLGDVAPSRSHAAFSRLIFDFIEGLPKPFFFYCVPFILNASWLIVSCLSVHCLCTKDLPLRDHDWGLNVAIESEVHFIPWSEEMTV